MRIHRHTAPRPASLILAWGLWASIAAAGTLHLEGVLTYRSYLDGEAGQELTRTVVLDGRSPDWLVRVYGTHVAGSSAPIPLYAAGYEGGASYSLDQSVAGNADFSPQELRGFTLFNNPAKGNCAKCHIDIPGPGGRTAQFTDFGFQAVGVPRNLEIAANRDPRYVDLGLCGPARKDLAKETNFCGMFKTPTLRNVASRQVFFHNGRFHTLEDMMHFYAERDSKPSKWYAQRNGNTLPYDDLPAAYRANVDRVNAPFNRKRDDPPALNDEEIGDVIAFLKTLDDGYSTQSGAKRAE